MELYLLNDVVIVLTLAIVVVFFCHVLRLPSLVGFLLTGIIAGPHGAGLVHAPGEVEMLAEIGVVLLLFSIGIEISLERLMQIRKAVLAGGPLQVALTGLLGGAIAFPFLKGMGPAAFIGCFAALSSTAVVLKLLQERAEVDSPYGRFALGVLIFQDLSIVPMLLLVPLMSGQSANIVQSLLILAAKGIAVWGLMWIAAKWIVPALFYRIASTRNQTVFLLFVIVMCFSIALFTSAIGLKLALGAFLAGILIANTEYSHQALGNILPFKEVFLSFFFISIGMLLDFGFLVSHPLLVLGASLGVMAAKAVIAGGIAYLLGFSLRTAILGGLAICQIGEFSFILASLGFDEGLIGSTTYQLLLAVSIFSMAATPFLMALGPRFAERVLQLPAAKKIALRRSQAESGASPHLEDHLVIIGFGVNGRNVARSAEFANIPYAAIEMNPETVRMEKKQGRPMVYGDAAQEAVLEHAHAGKARIVVIAINDPSATRKITSAVRRLNPAAHLIVRSRFVQEIPSLQALGANEVIPEEFETSVEIFTRVLSKYLVPRQDIDKLVNEIRSANYAMLRNLSPYTATADDLRSNLPDTEMVSARVAEVSQFAGKSLAELGFRTRYGVTVLAIRREDAMIPNPASDDAIQGNDILVLMGNVENLHGVVRIASGEAE